MQGSNRTPNRPDADRCVPARDSASRQGPVPLAAAIAFLAVVVLMGGWALCGSSGAGPASPSVAIEQVNPPDAGSGREAAAPPWMARGSWAAPQQTQWTEAREVAREPTPLSELELARVLVKAHVVVFGSEPAEQRLSVAWAQLALEHARGRDIDCNNLGNITLAAGAFGEYYTRVATERTRRNVPGLPNRWEKVKMRFRAFHTPVDGAVAYWKLIREQYTEALAYFDQGNGYLAARRLGQSGYMTAESQAYASAMGSLQQQFFVAVRPAMDEP
jgi:hypothetical protein